MTDASWWVLAAVPVLSGMFAWAAAAATNRAAARRAAEEFERRRAAELADYWRTELLDGTARVMASCAEVAEACLASPPDIERLTTARAALVAAENRLELIADEKVHRTLHELQGTYFVLLRDAFARVRAGGSIDFAETAPRLEQMARDLDAMADAVRNSLGLR